MRLETLGHAGMLLREGDGPPLLLTDPWLIGSTYWRSWWLQNYPTRSEIELLSRSRYVYVTHEHPDHFHPPSLRRLGKAPRYLCPDLPENRILAYLRTQDYDVEVLPAFTWRSLEPGTWISSIPLWNDDSLLLVDTPCALIVNINDSKPARSNLARLRRFIDGHARGHKPVVVLSSYSPASLVNSFFRNSQRVFVKGKADYARYISNLCDVLGADYFLPFASQAIFLRSDSRWANAFKVTVEDLEEHWTTRAKLLRPYSRMDLATGESEFTPVDAYNEDWRGQLDKVAAQEHLDEVVTVTEEDVTRLESKMRSVRWLSVLLFPRGFGFRIRDLELRFSPWKARIVRGSSSGHFTLNLPAQAVKDVLEYDHFGDLGITMFTIVHLNRGTRPMHVYLLFVVLTLHDYRHIASIAGFLRWVKSVLRRRVWRIPPVPEST